MNGLLGLLLLLASSHDAAKEEYREKLEKLLRNAAAKHYSVGGYLSMSRMHEWARVHYYKTIEYDPKHEKARRKLGYRKEGDEWVSDPSIPQKFANEQKSERMVAKVKKSLDSRNERLGRDLARSWISLGSWCASRDLEEEAAHAYRKAIEYDPSNEKARKALGYEKDERGVWLTKEERELRKEMRDGITDAPKGETVSVNGVADNRLGLKTRDRRSEHFLFESPHLKEAELADLVQHAEHAYAMYHRIFEQNGLFGGRRANHLVLQSRAQHVAYVNAFHPGPEVRKELARKSVGTGGFPQYEQYQGEFPMPSVQDMVVHRTAETLSRLYVGGEHHWLHEGVAYHFTRLMKGTALTMCVDLAGTSPNSDGKNYQDPKHWPTVCKVWVRDGKDPDINAVLKATNVAELSGAETVKAWSIVEFLLTDHREKFLKLCGALHDGADIEKALKEAFGWSTADLNAAWHKYVSFTY